MIGLLMMIVLSASYFESYPKESQYAVDFTSSHKTEIKKIKKHLSSEEARVAMCIVAPEVSQYSYMSDAAETFALYTLYVQGEVSDFSIGLFQMKPSFAISIDVKFPQTGKDSSKRGEIILCLSHGIPLTSA